MRNLPRLVDHFQSMVALMNPLHAWYLSTATEFASRIVAHADFCPTLLQLSQVVEQHYNSDDTRSVTAFIEHHEAQIASELEMLGIEIPVEIRRVPNEPTFSANDTDIEDPRSDGEVAFETEIADKERLMESNFARAYVDGTF